MGLFDKFRRTQQAEQPPAAPAAGTTPAEPKVPCSARIATFNATDAVGTLSAADGSSLRFGRSACRGFEPVVGADVTVQAVGPHPLGGFRALEIVLDSKSDTYDVLLAKRDEALGAKREKLDPVEEAAVNSQVLGWIVVLLDEAPPTGPQAFHRWATGLGLEKHGIRIITDGELRLGAGSRDALVYVGGGPFPRKRLADLGAPEGFDPGKGFIGLSLGIPADVPMLRAMGDTRDPWGPQGSLRALSQIARALLEHGRGIVLPHAWALASAERAKALLGDPFDPECRPFAAWLSWSVDPELRLYLTRGMVLNGLPDVAAEVDPDDPWSRARARDAILFACHKMVWSNRPLAEGELLQVPIGVGVGGRALEPVAGDVEVYRAVAAKPADSALEVEIQNGITLNSSGIKLVRQAESVDVRERWKSTAPGGKPQIAFNSYRELFLDAAERALSARHVTDLTPAPREGAPPFEVDVLALEDGSGYYMISNGIGRVPQPGGDPGAGTAHVELIAAMPEHHPLIASVVAAVAGHVHQHQGGENVFKPFDTIGLAVEELGAAGFVLRDAGKLPVGEGPAIHLMELIPLSGEEYRLVRSQGSRPWLEENARMTPEARKGRWRLRLN